MGGQEDMIIEVAFELLATRGNRPRGCKNRIKPTTTYAERDEGVSNTVEFRVEVMI